MRAAQGLRWWRRIGVGLGALVALSVGVLAAVDPPPARLTGAVPADGAKLSTAPHEVVLTFSGVVDPEVFHVGVTTAGGIAVTAGPSTLSGPRISVPVSIPSDGTYLVGYHVRLVRGSELTGVSRFTVGVEGSPAAGATPTTSPGTLDSDDGHGHGRDPLSLVLLVVGAILTLVVLVLLGRRPRPGERERRTQREPLGRPGIEDVNVPPSSGAPGG